MPEITSTPVNGYVPPWPGELVDIGTSKLFVRSVPPSGPGPEPTVFIHGLGGSSTNWTELMALLRDRVDGVAPDLPGFGLSPPPPDGNYELSAHVGSVVALIRQRFGGQRVHVFGNSLGGAVALQLAAAQPQLVRSMTLVSPALPDLVPRRTNVHMPLVAIPGLGERLTRRVMARDVEWRVNSSMDVCYSDVSRIHPNRLADQLAEAREREGHPHASEAILKSLRGLLRTYFDRSQQRPWQLARQILVPVLLIYGRDDKLVNSRTALRAHKAFPNARVVVVPNSGHVTQMEHPEVVAQAWQELVRGVS